MGRTDDASDRHGLVLSVLFAVLCAVPLLGSAFHMDEPYFLAIARQISRYPLHPLSFDYNWFGSAQPMSQLAAYAPSLPYLEAAALRLTGGSEWAMRLLFLPFDILAAASLYGIASRFLRRPLLPVLLILASPGYLLGMRLLMAEKLIAAFGFSALYSLCRGLLDERRGWYWLSALLLGLALLAKPSAIFLLAPVLWWQQRRGVPWGRIALHLAAGLSPCLLALGLDMACGNPRVGRMGIHAGTALSNLLSDPAHTLRSLLAFAGGGAALPAAWPFLVHGKRGSWAPTAVVASICLFLFLPSLDRGAVHLQDRALGFLFAAGALLSFWTLIRSREPAAADLWVPWAASVAVLQVAVYWSVVGRFMMFIIPPFVLGVAACMQAEWPEDRCRRLQAASLALLLPLSACLLWADSRHADAQKRLAARLAGGKPPSGGRLWFTGHWGLQHYMESIGASALDKGKGGWEAVRKGDWVVVPAVNTNQIRPRGPLLADIREVQVDSAVPLRVMSGFGGQGAFYSSVFGFLPYCVSDEPVELFSLIEPR